MDPKNKNHISPCGYKTVFGFDNFCSPVKNSSLCTLDTAAVCACCPHIGGRGVTLACPHAHGARSRSSCDATVVELTDVCVLFYLLHQTYGTYGKSTQARHKK